MKIFIFSDMEGISGICRKSQVMSSEPHYSEGRKFMTRDINACIQGCIDGGAKKIVVRDGHGSGFNVLWDELDERAEYLMGAGGTQRFEGIEGFDGLILLGYHAKAGTFRGILEHTFSSASWQTCWMNGKVVGEFAIDAAIAGDYGVPVIMTSGDDKLCAEAKPLIKDLVSVQVKEGIHTEGGRLLPMKTAHQKIREGAAMAVKNCSKIKPYKVKCPVTLRLELVERQQPPFRRTDIKLIDGRTFEVTGRTVEEALFKIC
jgi:D-amino peptidase